MLQKLARPTAALPVALRAVQPKSSGLLGVNVRCITHSLCFRQEHAPASTSSDVFVSDDLSDSSGSESGSGSGSSSDSESDEESDDTPPLTYEEHGNDLRSGENPTQYRNRSIDEFGRSYGTGRRKTAVARVWIKPGMGQFTVNSKSLSEYFPSTTARFNVLEPFFHTETSGMFDVYSTVKGGGRSGQSGALRLGVARAIEAFEPSFKPKLKESE